MKKYNYLLLSSALIMGTLACQTPTQAASYNPAEKASNVNVRLSGSTASIEYYRSSVQVPYTIYHAVWSEENGQDDIKWYVAPQSSRMSVNLNDHKGSGRFNIHTYIRINGKMVGLNATEIYLNKNRSSTYTPTYAPTAPTQVSTNFSSQGYMDILVTNPPSNISELLLPTWSDSNGQDDIKWYRATKNPNGSYSLRVNLKDHNYETGTYHIHVYGRDASSGSLKNATTASVQVNQDQIPSLQPSQPASTQISTTTVDSEPSQPVTSRTIFNGLGTFTLFIQNVPNANPVNVAVWSEENGQDDIKWYSANSVEGNLHSGVIDLKHHKGTGTYHIHIYQNGNCLTTSTLQVNDWHFPEQTKPITTSSNSYTAPTTSLTNKEANTYPVGQCTWGAKELAPWVRNWWGNGGDWAVSAARAGFRVGSTPQVGAVACWTGGRSGYGHVALVTEVQSNTRIRVKESNYAGKQYIDDFRGWFDPTRTTEGTVSYIYPN